MFALWLLLGSCLVTQAMASLSLELIEIISSVSEASADLQADDLTEQIVSESEAIDAIEQDVSSGGMLPATAACAVFKLVFPGGTVNPLDQGYEIEEEINWSSTCWLPASCFVDLQQPVDVAVSLRVIAVTRSKFSVRGHGHNPNPGFSSITQEGVLLNLRRLDSLSLGEDGVLKAGAGSAWGALYEFAESRDRTVKGTRVQQVGIAGSLLGGGLPFLPSLHGLAADSIVNYEIVLANSSIINTNLHQYPELFTALKGGGTNFGVVTRFDILTYELVRLQYSVDIYNASDYENILNATLRVQDHMEEDPNIDIFLSVSPAAFVVGLVYASLTPEASTLFDEFTQLESRIGSIVELTNGTIGSLEADMDTVEIPYDARRKPSTITTTPGYDLYIQNHLRFLDLIESYPDLANANLSYTLSPFSSTAVEVGHDKGYNSLGLDSVAQTWWSFPLEWADAELDGSIQQFSDEIVEQVRVLAVERNQLLPFQFMNHASSSQTVLDSYGAENLARMKAVASDFDRQGLFQNLQKGGFLLRGLQ